MTNEIIELLEQSEYGIIAINEPNIFLDVCLPAEGCASDVAIWYDDKYPYGKPQTDEVARGSGNREYGCRRLREKLPNFSGVSFF